MLKVGMGVKRAAVFSGSRLLVKFYILPTISTVLYLLLVETAWHIIGFNPAFGLVTWLFIYGVFPFWFSRLAEVVTSTKSRRIGTFLYMRQRYVSLLTLESGLVYML